MKLEELRRQYMAPAATEEPEKPTTKTIVGVDPASGPDSVVGMLLCERCDMVLMVSELAHGDIVLAHCPKCDVGCSMCKRLRDDEGNRLEIRETGAEKRWVCIQCCFDYYDILADCFHTEKRTPDGRWPTSACVCSWCFARRTSTI